MGEKPSDCKCRTEDGCFIPCKACCLRALDEVKKQQQQADPRRQMPARNERVKRL